MLSKKFSLRITLTALVLFFNIQNCFCEESQDDSVVTDQNIVQEDPSMQIQTPAFNDQDKIPAKYTCQGENISPEINWQDVPDGAESLVLLVDDPDAPKGTWTHWILYNISPKVKQIVENAGSIDKLPKSSQVGLNSWNRQKYDGPCPPYGIHRYYFTLYALDTKLDLDSSKVTSEVLKEAMSGHVLVAVQMMGKVAK